MFQAIQQASPFGEAYFKNQPKSRYSQMQMRKAERQGLDRGWGTAERIVQINSDHREKPKPRNKTQDI